MKKSKEYTVIDRYRNRVKEENKKFVQKNIEISNQISEILKNKGLTQKQFAQMLGKQESEVSKWLSGLHNITLKSITLMEAYLEEEIILTPLDACKKYSKVHYVMLKENATKNPTIQSSTSFSEELAGFNPVQKPIAA